MLQERLFEELIPLISAAAGEQGADAGDALRALECKVEQIHTTLRKHLSKEEDQLLPLLLANFSTAEQVCPMPLFLLLDLIRNVSCMSTTLFAATAPSCCTTSSLWSTASHP